jgi:hypothetical protein
MSSQTTTILIRKETRQLLQEKGRKSQTYDELINEVFAKYDELAAKYEKCRKKGGLV